MNTKKCIWIVNQYAGSVYHGMNYRSYYFALELIKKGYKVHIVSGAYSHLFINKPCITGRYTNEEIDGISYTWVDVPHYKTSKSVKRFWSMLVFLFRLFFLKMETFQKPDVILVSSISPFPILWAYLKARRYKAKLVFEVRDIWPLTLMQLGSLSQWHPVVMVLQWIENFAYSRSDFVVSLLPKAYEHMRHHGLSKERFRYIPNGIDINEVAKPQELSKDIAKKLPEGKFLVGYVGTIGIANALEYLIDAAVLLRSNEQIHIVLVGKGGHKEALQKRVQDEGLTNVTFIDPIEKKQVQSMLSMFDILYIGWHRSTIYEYGISANKLFDYMYAAKPILHSVEAGNDPVKESNCGLSVAPENADTIAKAIVKLSTLSEQERSEMGKAGRQYVLKYHTYSALSEKYEEFFKEV